MSCRTVPYDEDAKCMFCNKKGAFDFVGDTICPDCAVELFEADEDD